MSAHGRTRLLRLSAIRHLNRAAVERFRSNRKAALAEDVAVSAAWLPSAQIRPPINPWRTT